jgi:CRP-like cAMP-binding protein
VILDGLVGVHILKIDPENAEQPEQVIEVADIGRGQVFGDYALLHNDRRGASIFVKKNSHFLVLYKNEYLHILGKADANKLKDKTDFLQSLPLFSRWTERKLAKVSAAFKTMYYTRNQPLFSEGDPTEKVYIVKEGEFILLKNCKYTRTLMLNTKVRQAPVLKTNIKQVQVAIIGAGEIIGDEDVLKMQTYSTSCKCQSTSGVLLEISVKTFSKRIVNDDTRRIMQLNIDQRSLGRDQRLSHYKAIEKSFEKSVPQSESSSPTLQVKDKISFKSIRTFSSIGRNRSHYNISALEKTLDRGIAQSSKVLKSNLFMLHDSPVTTMKSSETARAVSSRSTRSPMRLRKIERKNEIQRENLNCTSAHEVDMMKKIFPFIHQDFSRTYRGIKLHRVQEGMVIRSQSPEKRDQSNA